MNNQKTTNQISVKLRDGTYINTVGFLVVTSDSIVILNNVQDIRFVFPFSSIILLETDAPEVGEEQSADYADADVVPLMN